MCSTFSPGAQRSDVVSFSGGQREREQGGDPAFLVCMAYRLTFLTSPVGSVEEREAPLPIHLPLPPYISMPSEPEPADISMPSGPAGHVGGMPAQFGF